MTEQFMEFGSLEQMVEFMDQQTQWANAHLAESQRRVTWGSHWVRFYDVPNRIIIFGKVFTEAEMVAAETAPVADDEEPERAAEEAGWTIARLRENHERGYLFGMAYSILEPAGEPGDTHRANLWPISEGLFEAARVAEWRVDDLDVAAKFAISETYAHWTNHQRTLAGIQRG